MRPARARYAAVAIAVLVLTGSARAADEIHWTFMGETAVSIDWRGTENTVRYGLTTSYGNTATAVNPTPSPFSSSGPFWEARITGLAANTQYHYSVGSGPDHMFHTPPARGTSDFVICVEGDIGDASSYGSVMTGVQQLIADQNPAFVLGVGDLTYANSHGQSHCDQHFNDVMVWSQNAGYMPAWGNHEWDTSGDDLRNYKGRFDLPNPQTSPGSPSVSCCGEDWYWFDYGNVRFIAYPEPWSGAWSDWKTKADAIMTDVDSDAQIDFIVTYGHRPAYSSGHHPGESSLAGYVGAMGQKHPKYLLHLNGHSHNYERTYPQSGVTHITAGQGGSTHERDGSCGWLGGCTPPSYSAARAFRHGPLRLRFTRDGIDGTMICGPSASGDDVSCTPGTPIDTFTIPGLGHVADDVRPGTTRTLTAR